jgi:hypothetical protein
VWDEEAVGAVTVTVADGVPEAEGLPPVQPVSATAVARPRTVHSAQEVGRTPVNGLTVNSYPARVVSSKAVAV